MKMTRMTKDKFFSYILDERKTKFRSHPIEIYYHNPMDTRGEPSSFVLVVVLGHKMGEVYVGASKYNPLDTKMVSRTIPVGIPPKQMDKIKERVPVSGFSLEEGLKQACNRVWREMNGMPSLYGKDHGPKEPSASKRLAKLRGRITAIARSATSFPSPFRIPMSNTMGEARRKLIAAISEEKHAAKKHKD